MPKLLSPDASSEQDVDDVYEATRLVSGGKMGVSPDATYRMITEDGIVTDVPGTQIPEAIARKYRFASDADVSDYRERNKKTEEASAKERLDAQGYGAAEAFALGAHKGGLPFGMGEALFKSLDTPTGGSSDETLRRMDDLESAHPYAEKAGWLLGFGGTAAIGGAAGRALEGASAGLRALGGLGRLGTTAGLFGKAGEVGAAASKAASGALGLGELGTAATVGAGRLAAEGAAMGASDLGAEAVRMTSQERDDAEERLANQTAGTVAAYAEHAAATVMGSVALNLAAGAALHGAANVPRARGAFKAGVEAGKAGDDAMNAALQHYYRLDGALAGAEAANAARNAADREAAEKIGEMTPEMQKRIAEDAEKAAKRSGVPGTREMYEQIGPANKTREAELAREMVNVPRGAQFEADRIASRAARTMNKILDDAGEVRRDAFGAAKDAHAERMVQSVDATTPATTVSELLHSAHATAESVSKEAAINGMGAEAHQIAKIADQAATRALRTIERYAPEQYQAVELRLRALATGEKEAASRLAVDAKNEALAEKHVEKSISFLDKYKADKAERTLHAGTEYEQELRPVSYEKPAIPKRPTPFDIPEPREVLEPLPKADAIVHLRRVMSGIDDLFGGLKLSPEATRQLNGELFAGADDLKGAIQRAAARGDRLPVPGEGARRLQALGSRVRTSLEDAGVWGRELAEKQASKNAANTRRIVAEKSYGIGGLIRRNSEGLRVVDKEAMARLVQRISNMEDTLTEKNVRDLIDAHVDEAVESAKFASRNAKEGAHIDSLARELHSTLDEGVRRLRNFKVAALVAAEQANAVRGVARLAPGSGGGLGSLALEAAASHAAGYGAAPGIVAGAALAPSIRGAMRPATKIADMASRQRAARAMDLEVKGAVGKFLEGTGLERLRARKMAVSPSRAREYALHRIDMREALEKAGKSPIPDAVIGDDTQMGARAAARQKWGDKATSSVELMFRGAVNLIRRFHDSPDTAHRAMVNAWTDDTADLPESTHAFVEVASRAFDYLDGVRPKPVQTNPFMPPTPDEGVSKSDMLKFVRTAEAVFDPMTVFASLDEGTIRPEQVDALKSVYPSIYESAKAQIVETIGELGGDVPYRKAQALGVLFDMPTTMSQRPEFVSRMQAAYMTDDQANPTDDGMGQGRGRPRGPGGSPSKLGASYATQTQAIETRATT